MQIFSDHPKADSFPEKSLLFVMWVKVCGQPGQLPN